MEVEQVVENAVQSAKKLMEEIDWSSELRRSICGPPEAPAALASAMAAVLVMGLIATPWAVAEMEKISSGLL
jgi:hypothetical protein